MSKGAGTFVTLRDRGAGRGSERPGTYHAPLHSHLDFDLDVAKEQSRENPVYYVQYAHARLASLSREGGIAEHKSSGPGRSGCYVLELEEEQNIIKRLGKISRDDRRSGVGL